MGSQSSVVLRTFDQQQLKQAYVISGISPNAMRRVFGGWILFAAIVGIIVTVAPDLSHQFISLTLFVLVSFTLVMFWQSRIAEGWPAIICADDYIGVVVDPVKREFICVNTQSISNATPTLIKPNKKAVEITIDSAALHEEEQAILKQAVWPRNGKLVGLVHFKHREEVCERILACAKGNVSLSARPQTRQISV